MPIHIEAMTPQNSAGCSVMTDGPGWMPWMIMAPIISAMTGLDGMPSVSIGMNDVCAPALLADSGPATPSMAPWPNSPGVARHLLLQRVGGERGEHGAAAGQDAEEGAEHGAAQDGARPCASSPPGWATGS